MQEYTIPPEIWTRWRSSANWLQAELTFEYATKFLDGPVGAVLNLGCGSDNSYDNAGEIEELPYGPFLTRFLAYHGIPSVNIDIASQGEHDLLLPNTYFIKANIFGYSYPSLLDVAPWGFNLIFCNNVISNPTKYYSRLMPYGTKDSVKSILGAITPVVAEGGIVKIDHQIFKMHSDEFLLIHEN